MFPQDSVGGKVPFFPVPIVQSNKKGISDRAEEQKF